MAVKEKKVDRAHGHVKTQTMQTVQTECYFSTCTLIF